MCGMARRGYLSVRMDEELMNDVHAIFSKLGLSTGDALSVFYSQVKAHQGFPFEVKIPNAETIRAMRESELGINLTHYSTADEMFKSWGEDPA
jgi:DNA-damage-inducible protein J